jgi:[ribosomal protein S18]-alanine N-acetyltransferase
VTATETGVQVETGGIDDLADVMIVMRDAFDPEYGEAWTEAQCAGILGMPGSRLLIARRGREAAGFAMTRTVIGETELLLIAVRPVYRRGGVARALLDRTILDATADRARTLHLEVRDGNGAALLYAQAGFVQVGRRRQYYRGRSGKLFDALTFKRHLSGN